MYYKHNGSRPITDNHAEVNNQINLPLDQSQRTTYIPRTVTQQIMKCAVKKRTDRQTKYRHGLLDCHCVYTRENRLTLAYVCVRTSLVQMIIVVSYWR